MSKAVFLDESKKNGKWMHSLLSTIQVLGASILLFSFSFTYHVDGIIAGSKSR